MAAKYIFHSYAHNPRVFKSLIAAKFGGITDVSYPQDFKWGVTNKTPEFLQKSTLGKVPLLETPDGPVWESDAILRYIVRVGKASEQLLGKTPYEQSEVDRWVDVFNFYIANHFALVSWHYGFSKFDQEKFNATLNDVAKAIGWIEAQLTHKGKKYLLADHITMADIVLGTGLVPFFKIALDKEFRSKYPKTDNYLKSLWVLDEFKSVQGEVVPVEKFEPPKAA